MPDTCTCGAELPPDALFCHKCGKPQREIRAVEPELVETPTPTAAPPPAAAAGPPTFRDRVAVRIALRVGIAATILGLVLPFINWLMAGFFAVFFYRRNTGRVLNVNAGVHLGRITGILMFPMWALAVLAELLPDVLSGHFGAAMQERIKTLQVQDPAIQHQMAQMFQSGPVIAASVLLILAFFFLLVMGLSIAGGAIGAKVSGRQ